MKWCKYNNAVRCGYKICRLHRNSCIIYQYQILDLWKEDRKTRLSR